MPAPAARILLWLFVINIGIAFGAGLYEHRIVVPHWITSDAGELHWNAEAARRDDTGLKFWVYVTTVPLTLLTLANLVAAWTAAAAVRRWWLAAGVLVLADRVLTFSYFIPTMIGLLNAPDSPAWASAAAQWSSLNDVRHALVLGGWIAALETFARVYRTEGMASTPDEPIRAWSQP